MATVENLVKIINTIRASGTEEYQNRIPVATAKNLSEIGSPIMAYSAMQNEFLNSLVNRIGLVMIRNKTYNNPLAILKQGSMPLGSDVEEIYTNPAIAETYNAKSTDLLAQTTPDTKAIFHRLNRKDKYKTTINREMLQQAFVSWDKFESLITSIVNTLYSGNYIDEFILCKNLFASAIENNKIITTNIDPITNKETAMNFITSARLLFSNFGFPSTNFNAYSVSGGTGKPVTTWTPPEDIRFIIRSDIEAITDVNVLANAFNMDKTTFLGQTLVIDNFGSAENCVAVMCDKSYTQIYDNLLETTDFRNSDNLTWNYYLHVWQTYSVSTLCNAVAFLTV